MQRNRLLPMALLMCAVLGLAGQHETESAPKEPVEVTVYMTRTGARYHRDGCRSLSRSRIPISPKVAKERGLTPCRVCRPPA